ncbi:17604_t:CDS:1, partial [Gigaspora rosea]
KNILKQLFEFGNNVPEAKFLKVLAALQAASLDWTIESVKLY